MVNPMRFFAICTAAMMLVACGDSNNDIADELAPQSYGEEESNVELWLETMEIGSRELYSARSDVVEALDLGAGERIADIGAGTGLYSVMFAQQVGASGAVFAVDIEPRFLKLIIQRAADLDLTNVTAVLGRDVSITLPEREVDVVFISDTYNYFADPEAIMRSVFSALKPGGRLYVLDFDLSEGVPRNTENQHIRVGKEAVKAEIETTGFLFDEEVAVPGLTETYMLRFVKPAQ